MHHSPGDPPVLRVKRAAHERLLATSGRENFSEVQWLEAEIADTDTALGSTGEPAGQENP